MTDFRFFELTAFALIAGPSSTCMFENGILSRCRCSILWCCNRLFCRFTRFLVCIAVIVVFLVAFLGAGESVPFLVALLLAMGDREPACFRVGRSPVCTSLWHRFHQSIREASASYFCKVHFRYSVSQLIETVGFLVRRRVCTYFVCRGFGDG